MSPTTKPRYDRRDDDYRIEEMRSDLADLRREFSDAMNGNGKPGFKIQIDRLEADMRLVKWLGGIIAVGLIGQLIAAFSGVILK